MSSGSLDPADGPHVGAKLARHRRLAGLSGKELAALVGMNQPKISRIETGAVKPDPADVRRIGEALQLPPALVSQLVDEAEDAYNDLTDQRAKLAGKQREVADYELRGRTIRVFQPTTIAGLLQTTAYAYTVMKTAHRMMTGKRRPPSEAALLEAVAGKVQRRENMFAGRTRVLVVLSEAALANRVLGDEGMLEQIEFLQKVSTDDRITIRVIPFSAQLPNPAVNCFELVDDRWLGIDLFNTSLTSQGKDDIRLYHELFDEMWEAATAEVEPILAEYARRYRASPA
ncbi:helix-turn-helix transcriptional regulator [Actinoplanes sp. NBRC 103695]|uniref:helix-turn-helix domain-containing protein n=1 Tax=Actinoplanes sp. NBRC 103695 TaxID=3032202 RepID=UPI0024A3B2F0|nr:helix-turn-helix transcriptional regulator [Actinoplanes sp. NBRC 103695]GLY95971.1 transcriptional regulator [Actinoplanes sp. NBRC 103695]